MTTAPANKENNTECFHPAFEKLRRERIDSLNVFIEEYRHTKTGAVHYHIAADNQENAFLVALRTIPTDSKGVAHILEHTALCGSERYPVRDPFFMMIRRSLNTFMNAFTSSDWTAYPFASQNRKDFYNLMEVYLDAVFFSRLDKLDFAQEGHRVEFETANDPSSKLTYKGVVFNEMKGAMSSPISTLWQVLSSHLFPTTTYHFNSGGEPEDIPDLSYDELKSFYKTHYHPSNAVFMTYGDIPAHEHQQYFEERALMRFDKLDKHIDVEDEKRYNTPQAVTECYATDENESPDDKTHIVIAWLLGRSIDMESMLTAHLLSGVLLDNSASPLRHALETNKLGHAPSPLCGLEDSNREMSFVCGIEGSNEQQAEALEDLILTVLQDVAENGIPQDRIEAVLHQLELSQLEISGDSYPYGLHIMLNGLSSAIHRGDVFSALNPDKILITLRDKISDPEFIKQLVRKNLLENTHRVRLVLKPDSSLNKQRATREEQRLEKIKSQMSDSEKQDVIKLASQLEARQKQDDDPGILPKVGLNDIPDTMHIAHGEYHNNTGLDITSYSQGTNGLAYQQIIFQLPQLENELLNILPYYTHCITELGNGGRDYLETQALQDSISGGVSAYSSVRATINNEQLANGSFILSGKALSRNHEKLGQLMFDTITSLRFDEHSKIREIIAQERNRREQGVTGNGHRLAMIAASSGMSPSAALQHQLGGLAGIEALKTLDDELNTSGIEKLAEKLQRLHEKIVASPKQFLIIGEQNKIAQYMNDIKSQWCDHNDSNTFTPISFADIRQTTKQAWLTNTQVNFCAKAYPAVTINHPDAASLEVLSGFLRNGYLHRAIREMGGAYGGGASYDSDNAAFRFYSYRDPRLSETLNDFDYSIDWLLNEDHQWLQLEEAILGVIGGLDKPGSPAGEAKDAFHNELNGRAAEQRQAFRRQVLTVTMEDLQRVAKTYLKAEAASIAVISNQEMLAECQRLDLNIFNI